MSRSSVQAEALGDAAFREHYGVRYAYVAGAMYKGIASVEVVAAMGKARLLAFFGSGGLRLSQIEEAVLRLRSELSREQTFGVNCLCSLDNSELEMRTVELLLKHDVTCIEAAAFLQVTPSLVLYRLRGLQRTPDGRVRPRNTILAKVSRPEVASAFMEPAPVEFVRALVAERKISAVEAELSSSIPMADDVCVEADSAGHTDRGVASALMPTILSIRDEMMRRRRYLKEIRIGAAGGIGTPQAVAAAFTLGAQFVLTGSVNQCSIEAGTSVAVKDLLETMRVQDTAIAPAGDMFELGAKIQVARNGLFFPARANKLYELYLRHNSWDEIDSDTRAQIERKFFRRSVNEVWEETRAYLARSNPSKLSECERSAKQRLGAILRWYFVHSTRLALNGDVEQRVDYQVHCGPALGAFNQHVRGTRMESWRNRSVAKIAELLMQGAADVLNTRIAGWLRNHATAIQVPFAVAAKDPVTT